MCQPAMEATKALAQRLRRRASLRKTTKKTAENAAGEYRAQAARNAYEKQKAQAAQVVHPAKDRSSDEEKEAGSIGDSPVTVTIPEPNATAQADSTSSLDAPIIPSPGSDISPTTIQPPKLAADEDNSGRAPTDTPTSDTQTVDYFALDKASTTGRGSPSKLITAVSAKDDAADGTNQEQQADLQDDSETAISSASPPSTAVSPRASVDDSTSVAARSSIVSMGGNVPGGWSRHSSMSSPLAFRLPEGTLPQGRTKASQNSRHRNSSPSVTSK